MKSMFRAAVVLFVLLGVSLAPGLQASQMGKEMNDADAELNTVYKRVLDGLPNEKTKARLREAQRGWVAFVEAEVALHTDLYTTSKGGLFIRLELTQTRIAQLKSIGKRDSVMGYGQGGE